MRWLVTGSITAWADPTALGVVKPTRVILPAVDLTTVEAAITAPATSAVATPLTEGATSVEVTSAAVVEILGAGVTLVAAEVIGSRQARFPAK